MYTEHKYKRPKPFILLILDGLGVAPPGPGNAVTLANTPNLDSYWFKYPHCYLHASGSAVGLPSGTNGNSEVGHTNIGAGKVVFQELPRIDNAIANETFFQNKAFVTAISHVKKHNSKLHLIGLVSRGRVHSTMEHLFACIKLCRKHAIEKGKLFVHAFTDGRDTPMKSAMTYLEELEGECERNQLGKLATIIGRFFAMDRDDRWKRTQLAYDLLVNAKGKKFSNWREAIKDAYENNETDEYISPRVLTENGKPVAKIEENDAIIFFNFRPDRAIQLTKAFTMPEFKGWERSKFIKNLVFVGMNEYEKGIPKLAAFPPEDIKLPIGRIISEAGLRQLRISESEKFPHVTYFFNGGNDKPYNGEDRIEIPSPKNITTYDQKPEMSIHEVTQTVINKIKDKIYDFMVINLANPDMVGHTGVLEAAIKAVEVTDKCTGKIIDSVLFFGGAVIIIADHGNAEEMINLQTGKIDTEHSTNPVPFIFISNEAEPRELSLGILADVSPTILSIMGIKKPSTMTGRNLLA